MTHATLSPLFDRDETVSHCIGLIERYAARMMKIGGWHVGSGDKQINRASPVRSTPEQRAKIVAMAKAGVRRSDIARECGCSMSTVYNLINRRGIACVDARNLKHN